MKTLLYFCLALSKCVQSTNLTVSDLVSNWEASKSWHIIDYNYGKSLTTLSNGYLKTKYPAGSYKPSGSINGGYNFYAQPAGFPQKTASFSYTVFFPSDFTWVKGGKLPGMWLGLQGANGGNHITDGASVRIMWRTNGAAEVYAYIPKQIDSYYTSSWYLSNGDYGSSLWRGAFTLKKNADNTIKLYTVCNTFVDGIAVANGVLRVTINGISRSYNKLIWTTNPQLTFNGLMMHTFFGGNDGSWAPSSDQYIYFKNFSI